MHTLRLALIALLRDYRSGELTILLLALLVAVSALTAVGFFTARVNLAVEQQAGEVLAADLRLRSQSPLQEHYFATAKRLGAETAQMSVFPSVVFLGEISQLAAVTAITPGYPLRGRLKIASAPFERGVETTRLPEAGEVWAEGRLLAALNAKLGDRLRVGAHELRVTAVLAYRPDQGSQFVDLAPTLLMRLEDVPATRLVQPGSRVSYIGLFAGPPNAINAVKNELTRIKTRGERLIDVADASPQIRSAMERAGRFLNLAAMVTVLLSAIAVAIASRRYVRRHLDTAALMKCMGSTQRQVLAISLLQLLVIGLVAAMIGSVIGYLAQSVLAWILRDLLRGELPAAPWHSAYLGLTTAVSMLLGFALPPLLQLRHVPPARVLRRNLEPPPLRYLTVYGAAVVTLVALMAYLVRDARLVAYVAGGTLATFIVLFAGGWLLVRALSGVRTRVGVAWRYGIANIARRGRESVVQIVAFGLGLMVLLLLAVVRNDLLEDWRASLPQNAPNHFLINIRPDEGESLRRYFADHGVSPPELAPMIRARMQAINGIPVTERAFTSDRARGFVEREANLTWSSTLQAGNTITAGKWWRPGDNGGARVSVEQEIADVLELKLGDELSYDVAGETIKARITSIRRVQWDTFTPNFFLVFSPGVLDDTAGTYITAIHLQTEQRRLLAELVRRFPEVTVIDVEALLTQVRNVMDKASLAVQYVFAFTLIAGVMVLLAAIQATRDERRYESAILRTLGAARRVVFIGVATEFTALGLLAGILAATGASVAGYFLAREVFNLRYELDLRVWLVGTIAGCLLVGISGTWAARSVVNHPPV
ncbi:MAG: FtsX-like permease family protein, partial [Steroidobacteraceae bacterium]